MKEYFPSPDSLLPHAGEKVTFGGEAYAWQAADWKNPNVNLYHFAYYNGKPTTHQGFWGATIVNSLEEISNGGSPPAPTLGPCG